MSTDPHLDASEAVRVQILATEHWSLLATRNITYGAIYSRATIFLTVVSAAVVALALAAEATEFGDRFYVFALLVLPIAFFIGVGTYIRLVDARIEDFWLLSGLNRLRHAYLEIAPELEPYFVTGHHDDERGLSETYGPGTENRVLRLIASTSTVVGVIDAVLAGVVGGLVAKVVGAGSELSLLIGAVVTSVVVALLVHADRRMIADGRLRLEPRFARSAEAERMREQQERPSSPRADVPKGVRAQILATEHWSLLAARDVTYRAVFSRAAIFLTVVSAAVVSLALVARATEFGDGFTAFALLVLPVALFVGVATYIRLIEARIDDFWLLSGMNRLRHAYLEISPGLEPYFVTGHHDDEQGLYETYGPGTGSRFYRLIGETSTLVAVINAALAGAVVGLVANAAGTGSELSLFIGAGVTTVLVVSLVNTSKRLIERGRRLLEPRFARQVETEIGASRI
jgi:cation transporter-like permease